MRDLRPAGPLVYDRLSDPILVRRAKDGDERRSRRSATGTRPRVQRIALHVLRDPEDARDAAQESLVKLVQRVGQFRGESQFSTWLHRLVVNTCKDVAQARWAAAAPHRAALRGPAGRRATGTRLARSQPSETRRELGRCLAELPAGAGDRRRAEGRVRRAVRGDLRGTGLPVGTAKCYAHRGRNGLRERLSA